MVSVSRRTVAKGAAWTLPVVSLAAAAPAASASTVACDACIKAAVSPTRDFYQRFTDKFQLNAGISHASCAGLTLDVVSAGSATFTYTGNEGSDTSQGELSILDAVGKVADFVFNSADRGISDTKTVKSVCLPITLSITSDGHQTICTNTFCWSLSPSAAPPAPPLFVTSTGVVVPVV